MNKDQIIYAGKLLVQFKLLKNGIDANLNFDEGNIHLKVVSKNKTTTFNVKTTESPKPGGGKRKDAVSWNLGKISADFTACVNIADDEVWLFTPSDMCKLAQNPSKDKLYIYTDKTVNARKKALKSEFNEYLLENRLRKLDYQFVLGCCWWQGCYIAKRSKYSQAILSINNNCIYSKII